MAVPLIDLSFLNNWTPINRYVYLKDVQSATNVQLIMLDYFYQFSL